MSLQFTLPIGQPASDSAADLVQYVELLGSAVTFESDTFSSSTPYARYQLSGIVPNLQVVPTLWPGTVSQSAAQMVRVDMPPSIHLQLRRLLGREIPIPMTATYGPVQLAEQELSVAPGSTIGQISSTELYLWLQDQDGYYLNPFDYFQLFEQHKLWGLPDLLRCPLIPAEDYDGPIRICGSQPAVGLSGSLIIEGGSRNLQIHNPPDTLPATHFSFLSNDTITLTLASAPDTAAPALRLINQSHQDHRGDDDPALADIPLTNTTPPRWQFAIEDHLRPHHATYTPGEGRQVPDDDPVPPLAYQLEVRFTGNNGPELRLLNITQDTIDIIRQEYVFHRRPYQNRTPDGLPVPERALLQPNHPPAFAPNFQAWELQRSNYGAGHGNILRNANEMYRVAQYMRNHNSAQLDTMRTQNPNPIAEAVTDAVRVTSSWRNPERNENLSGAAFRSNHQSGRALDMQSFHVQQQPRSPDPPIAINSNIPLHLAMFQAGQDLLDELIRLNDAANCEEVEILLEHRGDTLWSYGVANGATTATTQRGGDYTSIVGPPTNNTANDLNSAAAYATHVHVGWRPANENNPLTLPTLPEENDG